MLDIKLIRTNPEIVKENIKKIEPRNILKMGYKQYFCY